MPKDVVDAINRALGTAKGVFYDDRLATDNEVRNISTNLVDLLSAPNDLHGRLVAKQLGESLCKELYDALSFLTAETHIFQVTNDGWSVQWFRGEAVSLPAGIELIRTIMADKKAGDIIREWGKYLLLF